MNKKLKIAFVIDFIEGNGGGIVSTRRFINALRKKGHKIIIITTGKSGKDKVILKKYYPSFVKDMMTKMNATFAIPNENKIKDVLKDVDLVHILLPFYLGIKTITFANELNKPIITSFHVQAENVTRNLNLNYKYIVKKIYDFFIKYFYDRSDLVICPSLFAEKELKKYGLKTKTKVLTNGYPKEFKRLNLNRNNDKFVILNVGRLAKEKNQHKLINAVSNMKIKDKLLLKFIGKGPLKSELKKYAKQKKVNALFLGTVSKKKLIEEYNKCNLLVHYGAVELEGMAVLEGLATETNVLIYDINTSASPMFAMSNKNKFKTEQDLEKKILYWYKNQDNFYNNILPKQKRFITNFSLESAVNDLEKTYYNVLKHHKKHNAKNNMENAWKVFLNLVSTFMMQTTKNLKKRLKIKNK